MEESRKSVRRKPDDYFLVYDRYKDVFIGRLMNMSVDGLMLISEDRNEAGRLFHCRMALPEKIDGHNQITFDATSAWCRLNQNINMYETGYKFENISKNCRAVVKVLMQKWMVCQSDALQSWSVK